MKSGIYIILNAQNGHCYIGSTGDFAIRRSHHFNRLRAGKHSSPPLQKAFLKYGETALAFEIIEECACDMLLNLEQFYIDGLEPEYNTGTCAASARRGTKSSPEHCARMSQSLKGRISPLKGKRLTADHRRKISEANKLKPKRTGQKHSLISRAKMSAHKKRVGSPELRTATARRNRSNSLKRWWAGKKAIRMKDQMQLPFYDGAKGGGMTDTQVVAIVAPMAFNGVLIGLLILWMNSKFDAITTRFDDMRDLWRAELHRVEGVIDARLKHLEEK